uniref:Protein OPY2 n=1 Tax=Anthurium amnicola TaxID=1678845 RepID=A0A1D1XI92_9ARAE
MSSMFSMSKIKLCMLVWLVCIAVMLINIVPVTAQDTTKKQTSTETKSSSGSCISCDDASINCPECADGLKCVLTLRTCFECPKPSCVKSSPPSNIEDNNNNTKDNNKILLPVVIGGILGVGFLTAIGYASFVWKRKAQNERGVKLDSSSDEMISLNGENVIPIAYIPPTTPTTPTPEPTYLRLRVSNVSAGTTPLSSPLPRSFNDEQLIDIADDDDTAGTILQATKTAPSASTATLVTATRAKPALVRLNTIKHSTSKDVSTTQSMKSENSIPNTPKTPITSNTFLNAPSISSGPSSPTSNFSIRIECDSDTEQIMPHIDIERPSAESFRVTNQNTTSQNQNLNSSTLDPIEGRQSFGLFGSDEVYSNDPLSPQLHRESIVSSSSSNGRSTMFSDDGDGEIMIFWGGNTPSFATVAGGGCQTQVKEPENHVDSSVKDQNEETKTKESI